MLKPNIIKLAILNAINLFAIIKTRRVVMPHIFLTVI